ncbi:MAG: FtsX-like permease family protein [candidate division Zixibacteria bacterium]|nr:FtsX-like permease family protein [candidate division Zixibacteria bacterium]
MLSLKIAWRNIFRQKRRTLLTVLTMLGGFTLSAISIGWADGTYNRIIEMFTRNRLGHIQVHAKGYLDKPSLYKNIKDYGDVGKKIAETKGVMSWTPRFFTAGLASIEDKSMGVQIVGIDPVRENEATRFNKKIIEGDTFSEKASHQAILGKGLAKTLKADIGDEVVIISQAADGSIANDLYTVTAILESGNMTQDRSTLYLHLKDAQELFVLYDAVHEIAIIAEELGQVDEVTERIRTKLDNPELKVAPWQEFARSFYIAMKADKEGAWIMLFVVILIVAIGVLNTVLMNVLERTREYGTLRAIGTAPLQIFRLVIYEVAMMAIIGVIIGTIISIPANYLLSLQGIPMPEQFTYGGIEFTHYYSEVNLHSLYLPAITVVLSALIVSLYPATRAARIAPAKALRSQ